MRYDKYNLSTKEWVIFSLEYLAIIGIISFLFYDSLLAFFLLFPFFLLFIKIVKRICINNRLEELKTQFIQMISYMATSIEAGLSIENSVIEAQKDIIKMYDKESVMAKELDSILSQMDSGKRLEDIMLDFSDRTGVEEIKDFATVFIIAKKSGGRFSEIIKRSINVMISNKETEKQIQILISGKRYEQRILSIVPFIIIASLRFTSGDFISSLYHNPFGILIMTGCLLIYFYSIYLSEKISNIKC